MSVDTSAGLRVEIAVEARKPLKKKCEISCKIKRAIFWSMACWDHLIKASDLATGL